MGLSREEQLLVDSSLDFIGRNLTKLAEEGGLGPIYERFEFIESIAALLSKKSGSVLIVGEPGVGKNAVIEGLAKWIARKKENLPSSLKGTKLYEVSPVSFQANCLYAHDFETKIQHIVDQCKSSNSILVFDNLNLILNAGTIANNEDRTIANLLLPYISRKEITVIGLCTIDGLKAMQRQNLSFINQFKILDIVETTDEETLQILTELKPDIEKKNSITIDQLAFNELIELSERFFPWRHFPGKAFEILNEIIALKSIPSNNYLSEELQSLNLYKNKINTDDIYVYIKNKSGLPLNIIHANLNLDYEKTLEFFKTEIINQDQAIKEIIKVIFRYKAELHSQERPLGVFLFVGPTGVGKTQLAKVLAKFLFGNEDRLIRYDLSEYNLPTSVLSLVGDPSVYPTKVNLVDNVNVTPFSVILFDEIEKGHPDIYNLLLQVLGEGRLTDRMGRTANFNNSIIIMTSNIGSEIYSKKKMGINSAEYYNNDENKLDIIKSLKEFFAPEFINRLTSMICFNQLAKEDILKICKLELDNFLKRDGIRKRKIKILYEDDIIDYITEKGYDPAYGARPLKREIENTIGTAMAYFIAKNPRINEREIRIKLNSEKSSVSVMEINSI